jgi:cytochrome oxidase assembly protein ShyY1
MKHELRFRPPWWAVALAAAGCAAGIALGNWQSGRADEKRAAGAAAPVKARGELLARHTLFLQNRVHRGKPGYYVLQPLRGRDGRCVLVLRGWSAVAAVPRTPAGEVILEGIRRERPPRALEAGGGREEGNVRQNITIGEFASWSGLPLEPYVIEQSSALVVTQPPAPSDGLARDWPRPEAGAEKNDSYALQWYSLAALSLLLLLFLNLKIEKREP